MGIGNDFDGVPCTPAGLDGVSEFDSPRLFAAADILLGTFGPHYHGERNHQGLGNRLITPDEGHADQHGAVQRRERLGGMLNSYYRAAA